MLESLTVHMLPFLNARDGKVEAWDKGTAIEDEPDFIGSPDEVREWLLENERMSWLCSSSMDFGTEYGFDEDNVKALVLGES